MPLLLHSSHVMAGIVVILSRFYNGDVAFLEPEIAHYLSIYTILMVLAFLAHVLLASPLYAWAWHYPEPQELSKRRCTYGCMMDFFLGDLPTFVMGTKIVHTIQFKAATLGVAYCLSCISFFYTSLRVWLFLVQHVAKVHFLYEEKRSHPPYRPDDIRDSASLSFAFRLYSTPQGPTGDQTAFMVENPIQSALAHSSPPIPSSRASSSASSSSLPFRDYTGDEMEGLHPPLKPSSASCTSTEEYSGAQDRYQPNKSHHLARHLLDWSKKKRKEGNAKNNSFTFTSAAPSTTSFSSSSFSSSHHDHEEHHSPPHHHPIHHHDAKDDFSLSLQLPKEQNSNWIGKERRCGSSYPLKYSRFEARDIKETQLSNHPSTFSSEGEESGRRTGWRGTGNQNERRSGTMKTEEMPPKHFSIFPSSMSWRVRLKEEADSRGDEQKERDSPHKGTSPPPPQDEAHKSFLPSSFVWKPHPDRKYRVEEEEKKKRIDF